ncbi:hypothetical protein Ancab_019884 [Ancistrocladus abbreviatus]
MVTQGRIVRCMTSDIKKANNSVSSGFVVPCAYSFPMESNRKTKSCLTFSVDNFMTSPLVFFAGVEKGDKATFATASVQFIEKKHEDVEECNKNN